MISLEAFESFCKPVDGRKESILLIREEKNFNDDPFTKNHELIIKSYALKSNYYLLRMS
jgi:hypothetical protein